MSYLFSCQGLAKAYGAQTLFTDINLVINPGDRVGLIGPNGSGKSTLLKIICNAEDEDSGTILRLKHCVISYLAQEDSFDNNLSLTDNLLVVLASAPIEEAEKISRVQTMLSRAEFEDTTLPVSQLSGGWRKRLSVCRALVVEPDLLVMDEPTNHLDIEGILWLEKLLAGKFKASPSAYILVSHDRRFLENSVNRVIELSRVYPSGSLQVAGPYSSFLEERHRFLALQSEQEDRLANKVRRETEWLQRGPKARTTKARYRIDEAYRLQDELGLVKNRNRSAGSVSIDFSGTGRKTKKLLEANNLTKRYDDRLLFKDLDILLSPGSKLGLLGRNGCGKSTLIQILASAGSGLYKQDDGTITTADGLSIVSFSQDRAGVDQTLTLRRALAPDGDSISYQGRSIHVVSWAKRFLFRPDQLETPVAQLSGGEQARILIAALMREPADILLLDEPTNDLDIGSLDVLEESLLEFNGALVLVTHDRYLLDRVCDRIIGFVGDGVANYYADYEQWLRDLVPDVKSEREGGRQKSQKQTSSNKTASGRLSYMDQREYDTIEERILEAEENKERLEKKINDPVVAANPEKLQQGWSELEESQKNVEQLYQRWEELEQKKEQGN
jgi:ATP-binding cassette subfamily F protein uup